MPTNPQSPPQCRSCCRSIVAEGQMCYNGGLCIPVELPQSPVREPMPSAEDLDAVAREEQIRLLTADRWDDIRPLADASAERWKSFAFTLEEELARVSTSGMGGELMNSQPSAAEANRCDECGRSGGSHWSTCAAADHKGMAGETFEEWWAEVQGNARFATAAPKLAAHWAWNASRAGMGTARETQLIEALQQVKRRIHFIGWPNESTFEGRPDWRKEIAMIEAALSARPESEDAWIRQIAANEDGANVNTGSLSVARPEGGERNQDLPAFSDRETNDPLRCRLLDGKFFDGVEFHLIIEDGKVRPHWRCHKTRGHKGVCSTHNDCGEPTFSTNPDHRGAVCGFGPNHDGPHAWESRIVPAYRPKPKTKASKKRTRKAKKDARTGAQ